LLLFKDGLRRRYHPALKLREVCAPRNDVVGQLSWYKFAQNTIILLATI